MKKSLVLLFALGLFALPLQAQQPGVRPVPQDAHAATTVAPDPSAAAMRESQHLQKALGLDARQTRKVYKFFYSHFKKSMPQAPRSGAPRGMAEGPDGFGHPGGPGMGPGGPGHMDGMGRGPGGSMNPGERPQPAGLKAVSQEDPEAWRKTQEKKFRKIFTAEQYAAWKSMASVPPAPRPDAAQKQSATPRI